MPKRRAKNKRKDERKRQLRESMKSNGKKTAPDGACVKRKPYIAGQRTHDTKLRDQIKSGARKSLNMQLRAAEKGGFDEVIAPSGPPLMSFSVA